MKLSIDTTNQIISVENNVNLNDLHKALEVLLPNGLWKEYAINVITNATVINTPLIVVPIGYKPLMIPTVPYDPYQPTWTGQPFYQSASIITNSSVINNGIYNISI
jgi:hypothetical protein